MKHKITVYIKSKSQEYLPLELPNEAGFSLMEMLRACELPVMGTCGGISLCGSCHIYVQSHHKLDPPGEAELQMLDTLHNSKSNSRLSCQLPMNESLDQLKIELAGVESQ